MNSPEPMHFNQPVRRKAEFIKPPNLLKVKVGSGGLSDEILAKAQELLENNSVDFLPLAEMYLASLLKGIDGAREADGNSGEANITQMLYPAMQLKANGGMFHYNLITSIAEKLIQFLEVIETPDNDALEIVMAFHSTMRAVVLARITGTGGKHGAELGEALNGACLRYFERYPFKRTRQDEDFEDVSDGF